VSIIEEKTDQYYLQASSSGINTIKDHHHQASSIIQHQHHQHQASPSINIINIKHHPASTSSTSNIIKHQNADNAQKPNQRARRQ